MNKIRFLVIAVCFAAACGKSGGKGAGKSVDKNAYKDLVNSIHQGDAWDAATKAIEKVLGPATIKADAEWTFAADDGENCYDVVLQKDGDKVKGWSGGHVNKMVEKPYAECAAHAQGKQP